jgi:uncharacterized protein YggT (Ycf19 family)
VIVFFRFAFNLFSEYNQPMKAIARLVDLIGWALGALLTLRLVLRLLGADLSAPFVQWLYDITSSLMLPFRGIFPTVNLAGTSVLDIPALVAAIIYFLGAYFISALIDSIGEGAKSVNIKKPAQETNPPELTKPDMGQQNQNPPANQ